MKALTTKEYSILGTQGTSDMIYIDSTQDDAVITDGIIRHIEQVMTLAVRMQLGAVDPEISLIFTGEEEIKKLNGDFRGIDSVTDVLSFPANDLAGPCGDASALEHEGDSVVLGDIAICVKRAAEQALEYGNTLEEELSFLAVHGTLHLMGYDHMDEEQERMMRAMQRKVLGKEEGPYD